MMVPADTLANPHAPPTTPPTRSARAFFIEATAANGVTYPYRESVRPAMHHDQARVDAFFANVYSEKGSYYAAVHSVTMSPPGVKTVETPVGGLRRRRR